MSAPESRDVVAVPVERLYRSVTVYYWSGTGNSFRVASWMGDAAVRRHAEVRVTPLSAPEPRAAVGEGPDHLVGLVFPTHGFTAPWPVLRYCLRMPRRSRTHAFVIATRAGWKLGPFLMPGLEGTAAWLVAFLLFLRGYSVRGVTGIDMPTNWLAFHWGLHPRTVSAIIGGARSRLGRFAPAVLEKRRSYHGIVPLLLGLALAPVSAAYLLLGKFALARLFYASNFCTGCGTCARSCPQNAIVLREGDRVRPSWTFSCESCMRCMAFCPERAVEASHPLFIVYGYIFSTVSVSGLAAWALGPLMPAFAGVGGVAASIAGFAVDYLFYLAALWLIYAVFVRLADFRVLNALFTAGTLTHFWRRYHEPSTTVHVLGEEQRRNF